MATRLFSRSPARDVFTIDRHNRHQYYKTVQSEEHPQEQLDRAMERRRVRAMAWRRRSRSALWPWLGALLLVLAGGIGALL